MATVHLNLVEYFSGRNFRRTNFSEIRENTLREEILAGPIFGGFGGLLEKPLKSATITSCKIWYISQSTKIYFRQIDGAWLRKNKIIVSSMVGSPYDFP